MVAGDPEKKHMAECDSKGGIPYHPNVIGNLVSHILLQLHSLGYG